MALLLQTAATPKTTVNSVQSAVMKMLDVILTENGKALCYDGIL